jgi:sugar/nucleoside kinase (ribokinase family)
MNIKSADIAILGHFAKDIIEIDGISNTSLGGSVYYGGITGAHMGLKIIVITRLKKEDFPLLDILKKNGVLYFAYPSEETSGLKNIYSSKNMEFREYTPLGFAGLFKKEDIPEFKVPPKFFVLGNIVAGEVDLELLDYLKSKFNNICLDIQGFIRFRDHIIVFYSFPWKNYSSIGRTGRGDTALISYIGSRLKKNPKDSLKYSAALTSLKLESPGPFNLPLYQVEKLIKEKY